MPAPTIKTYDQLLAEALALLVAGTNLTDVTDTAVVKHLLAIHSKQLSEHYYSLALMKDLFSLDRAFGDDLDERAKDIQPGTLMRLLGARATGSVVFSRPVAVGTTTIPMGTKGQTSGGVAFLTTAVAEITVASPELIPGHGVGRDVVAPVQAESTGEAGNVAVGTIVKMVNRPAGVNAVTNLVPTQYGSERETDAAFRERLRNWVASLARGTELALETAVIGAQDPDTNAQIKFAKSVEDPAIRGQVVLYIDDGQGTAASESTATDEEITPPGGAVGGETRLSLANAPLTPAKDLVITSSTRGVLSGDGVEYTADPASCLIKLDPALSAGEVLLATYDYSTGLVALAHTIVYGDPSDRDTYPGYRAAGVLVHCQSPDVLLQNVQVQVRAKEGYEASVVAAQVEAAVQLYINSLNISEDLVFYELVERVMGVPGVVNATFATPTADRVILDEQLLRTTPANLSVTVS